MRNKLDKFFTLVKIGSGRKLLLFDLSIWLIILYDVYVINNLNLDVYHLSLVRTAWGAISVYYVAIAALMIYIPPVISALINFSLRDNKVFRESLPSRFRKESLVLHFVTSVAFTLFISISHELEVLSGFNAAPGGSTPVVLSSYEYSPLYSSIYLKAITASAVLGLIANYIFEGVASRTKLDEFKLWFNLSDTSTSYFPKQRENLIFVNTASMAPSINWISGCEELYRHAYQKMVPTSDDAKKYLMSAAKRSREFLHDYLFHDTEQAANFSIEFLPGTSRALEVGLTQIENLHTIIVSPYEHPSQYNVVDWYVALNPSIKHVWPQMDYTILNGGWNEQKAWLIEKIRSAIPADAGGGKVAILISEVHYLTGLFINVTEIVEELRPDYRTSNLVFMVDGSQSVGNLLRPFDSLANELHREDFYYFSAHKWLLSPNTCGVFIAQQDPNRYKVYPYDIFGAALPSATIDPGVIFGIRSSLEYLVGNNLFHLTKFHEKSSFLKAYFIERISDKFEVIESDSPEMNRSNFIAVRPRNGYKWRDEKVQDFWAEITRVGVDLTVVNLPGTAVDAWWLRISFPYFLQVHLLKQLIKHLKARVKSIN